MKEPFSENLIKIIVLGLIAIVSIGCIINVATKAGIGFAAIIMFVFVLAYLMSREH